MWDWIDERINKAGRDFTSLSKFDQGLFTQCLYEEWHDIQEWQGHPRVAGPPSPFPTYTSSSAVAGPRERSPSIVTTWERAAQALVQRLYELEAMRAGRELHV